MRRLMSLANSLYHKNYREIYKILFLADLDEVSDHSNWYKPNPDYVDKNRPLWIIAESKILNKRIWITQDFGSLQISTAQLDLDVKTNEYSNSFIHKSFKTQKEMTEYLEKLLEPCLEETKEEEKFDRNLKEWKNGLKYAEERKAEFYEKESDLKYITLKDVGKKYSKKLANIMFELGYGEWIFNDYGTLENMEDQMIDILEEDKDLNELLEEKKLTREQLYRQIKENFLESELANYLQDNFIDTRMIPENIKENMIKQVKKGMIDNYLYKFIIWNSGDLEALIELLPKECFIKENTVENVNSEGEEL